MKVPKETIKNVVIAVLVTAQIAFVLGIKYQQAQTKHIEQEVQKQVQSLKDEVLSEKK